jgi:hypothetical protein
MIMNDNHLSTEDIQFFIQLTFHESENDRVIAHLSNCDACLLAMEAAWEEIPQPNLDESKVKKRLWQNINRSNLAGNLLGLGMQGFLNAIVGLLSPLLRSKSKKRG